MSSSFGSTQPLPTTLSAARLPWSDRQDRRYLLYILESIALVERRTRAGRNAFFSDIDAQDAVLWRLQTLAESSSQLSDELKRRHPEIRWRAIYGFRNIAAHGYLDLRLQLVREIIESHLGNLKSVADEELQQFNTGPHCP